MNVTQESAVKPERLTHDQMMARYPDEWVVLTEPEPEKGRGVRFTGHVHWHGRSEQEAKYNLSGLGSRGFALMYMGDPTPPGYVMML